MEMDGYLCGALATRVSCLLALFFFRWRKQGVGLDLVFRGLEADVETGIRGTRELVEAPLAAERVLRGHAARFPEEDRLLQSHGNFAN